MSKNDSDFALDAANNDESVAGDEQGSPVIATDSTYNLPELDADGQDEVDHQDADLAEGPDPFDLAAVKKKAASSVAVKKTLAVRTLKRIDKNTWFQVCPMPEMHIEGYLMDPGDIADGLFWVSPHVLEQVDDSTIRLYSLHLCATKHGNSLFWWAIGLPGEDGRDMECDQIRREYANLHGKWQRLEWNQAARMHDQSVALANWPDPDWPNKSADDLIRLAFRGRVIDSPEHPVVLQIKGVA